MARPNKPFRIETYTGDTAGVSGSPVAQAAPRGGMARGAGPAIGPSAGAQEILAEIRSLRELFAPQQELSQRAIDGFRQELADAKAMKAELDAIQEAITRTKHEIATLHVSGFKGPQMVRVTGELDAIVQGTLDATETILTAAEGIDKHAGMLEASCRRQQEQQMAADIRDQAVRIFEACNFQDLTGQRITKVVNTLKFIEGRILRMTEIWGGLDAFQAVEADAPAAPEGDAALLNGPRLEQDNGHASQDDIDALFG